MWTWIVTGIAVNTMVIVIGYVAAVRDVQLRRKHAEMHMAMLKNGSCR